MTADRREQAIEEAARAAYEWEASCDEDHPRPSWEAASERTRAGFRYGLGPIVDAVLATDDDFAKRLDAAVTAARLAPSCDCAERLDAEAERLDVEGDSWCARWAARFLRRQR